MWACHCRDRRDCMVECAVFEASVNWSHVLKVGRPGKVTGSSRGFAPASGTHSAAMLWWLSVQTPGYKNRLIQHVDNEPTAQMHVRLAGMVNHEPHGRRLAEDRGHVRVVERLTMKLTDEVAGKQVPVDLCSGPRMPP